MSPLLNVSLCVRVCVCVRVLLFCVVALVWPFGLFLDFFLLFLRACVCTVTKPEVPPSHLTSEEHGAEKDKEEEQIQLLLEADGRSAP